jgi:dynein heavy chain
MNLEKNDMAVVFRKLVEEIKDTMPVVTYLRDPALKDTHKQEINDLLDEPIDTEDEEVTLQTLIDMNVKTKKDEIGEIALKASK